MNSTHLGRNKIGFRDRLRNYRMGRRFRHDPWLVLNMATFNSEGGWNRTFNPLRASSNATACFPTRDKRVDEALWSNYRRYDRSAKTKELLQRYLQAGRKHRARRRKLSHG